MSNDRQIFFTSDHHFGHANILVYEAEMRRNASGAEFSTVEEMDEYLIRRWNDTVAQDDLVYCLGDFCYNYQQMSEVLPQLNGEKVLIVGNHDPFFPNLIDSDPTLNKEARELALRAGFSAIHLHYAIELPRVGLVRLSHFPYKPPLQEGLPAVELRYLDNRPPRGEEVLLLHGHVHSQWRHNQYQGLPRMINVGVEMWQMHPATADEIADLVQGLDLPTLVA